MNTTVTEIKHFENSFAVFDEFGIKMDLDKILVEEFERGFSSDIDHPM